MRLQRMVVLAVVYAASVALAFEIAGRVNYFSHHDLSFWAPSAKLFYRYYPDLLTVDARAADHELRVLILGGSTLNHGFSDADDQLRDTLQVRSGRTVRIFNLAMPAQGSLDSYYKYWCLRNQSFDLVILYNGINELRANNVPEDVWQDGYGHYAWYEEVNFLFRHYALTHWYAILPFYVQHLRVALDRKFVNPDRKIPYNSAGIRPEWMRFGDTIRSAEPFRRNLERTLALAREKEEPVLLMTFAYCIAPGYSRERFEQGALGYDRTRQGEPVELWGLPAHIVKGLAVHNDIIRAAAATHGGVLFVDQEQLMGHDPKDFIDVCHFSPRGSARFARHIMTALARQWVGMQTASNLR